ncbi:MAG: CPBP family intramembrane metalloprotease [Clostridia bacterium]|nr:CPBP family intramembrane metalloprotease [Clostridia bacterium]
MREDHFKINEANAIFIILSVVFLTFGAYVQSLDVIKGLLITEYGILLLPIIIYALVTKKDIKNVFRLNRLPFKVTIKIMVLAVFLVPTIALVNLIAIFIIEMFSSSIMAPIPTAQNGLEFIFLFFVIAITAGICEEFFFRGMILNAYENEMSLKAAAIFSAVLFGIFHFNPQNLFGPIVLGLVFSYLVQITNSIYAAIIAHVANNGIAVTMGFLITLGNNGASSDFVDVAQGDMLFQSTSILLGVILFYLILSIASIVGVKTLLRRIKRAYPRYEPGDTLTVQLKQYKIVENTGDEIHIVPLSNDVESDKVLITNIEKIKEIKGISHYKLWTGESNVFKFSILVTLMISLTFYGYVIYYAYIKVG